MNFKSINARLCQERGPDAVGERARSLLVRRQDRRVADSMATNQTQDPRGEKTEKILRKIYR